MTNHKAAPTCSKPSLRHTKPSEETSAPSGVKQGNAIKGVNFAKRDAVKEVNHDVPCVSTMSVIIIKEIEGESALSSKK